MPRTTPPLTLLQGQTRLINASEGFCLEVLSGCLWLTRPGDAVDRFLVAGSRIDLHENQVLVESDKTPGSDHRVASLYRLTPLQAAQAAQSEVKPRAVRGLRFWRLQPSCA